MCVCGIWGWQLLKVVCDVACTKIQSNYRGVLVRRLICPVLRMDKGPTEASSVLCLLAGLRV